MHYIDLRIEKPAYGGYGLGFHNGKACFVRYALPGDIAYAEIYKEKRDFSFARIIKLKKRSEIRTNPECPNFGICGGCDYLNLSYENELMIKKDILTESLIRTGRFSPDELPEISIISGNRLHYRSHASVKSSKSDLGFYMKESNRLIAFPGKGCLLLDDKLIQMIKTLKDMPKEFKIAYTKDSGCHLSTGKQGLVRESECGILYERDITLFFQANKFLRKEMLKKVGEYSGLTKTRNFIDIGCGVGFFTLYLTKSANKGYGIDIDRECIKWAKHNAKLNNIDNIIFEAKPASEIHPYRLKFNALIADPPRAGLSAKARKTIRAIAPERIIYVSCNPSTFARDAKDFVKAGYNLKELTLIDMFPGTYHIETIALFIF